MKTKLEKYLNETELNEKKNLKNKDDVEGVIKKILGNKATNIDIDEYSDAFNVMINIKDFITADQMKKIMQIFNIESIGFNDNSIELEYNR